MTDFSLNSQGVFRVYIRVLGFVDLGFRAKGFKFILTTQLYNLSR